jgi:hypothetical protein
MTRDEKQYQDHCLRTLMPIVGRRIESLVRDDGGNFGFRTDDGTVVWIMADPEGNGPGFAEVSKP